MLGKSSELQITEEDSALIRNLLYYIQYLMHSQFTLTSAFAINQRRALVTGFTDDLLLKVAQDNTFLFGGKFLDQVNETLSVQKTADDIASRCKKKIEEERQR